MALRLNPAALTGYIVNASTNADTFELLRIDGVSGGALQEDLIGGVLAPGLFPFDPGNRWNIELGAVADRISMKVWRVGDLEPDLAQITAIDSTYTTGNLALFALRGTGATGTGAADATFDNIRFRPTPEPLTASMGLIGLAVLSMSTCRRRGRRIGAVQDCQ